MVDYVVDETMQIFARGRGNGAWPGGMMMMYDGLMDGFTQAIYGNAIRVLGGNIPCACCGLC